MLNCLLYISIKQTKAIILYEAEKLSLESVLYIKWMVEKYKGCNKLFFCCSDESRLQPIQSHCTTVRLSSPSTQQVTQHFQSLTLPLSYNFKFYSISFVIRIIYNLIFSINYILASTSCILYAIFTVDSQSFYLVF